MYIDPITIRKRKKLTEILKALKTADYQAFISKAEDSAYGMVEKDGHIVGIHGAPYGMGLRLSYHYRPNKNHGSGVGYGDPDLEYSSVTEADIRECIRYGAGYVAMHKLQRYQDVQEFLNHYDLYVPI